MYAWFSHTILLDDAGRTSKRHHKFWTTAFGWSALEFYTCKCQKSQKALQSLKPASNSE